MHSRMLANIKTSAGELRCYRNGDPSFPGFYIALQPSGADFEIDIAMVEAPENEEYLKSFEIAKGDVMVYLWGNVYDEDYTDKREIRRKDIEEMIKREEQR